MAKVDKGLLNVSLYSKLNGTFKGYCDFLLWTPEEWFNSIRAKEFEVLRDGGKLM